MIYASPYNNGFSYPAIDIPELILDHNLKEATPEKRAIIDGDTGSTVFTYGSLRSRIIHFGGFLQQTYSLKRGDVVSFLSFNTTYYPIVIHSTLATGATVSAFNPAYTPEEIAHSLKLAKPNYIFVQHGLVSNLEAALQIVGENISRPSVVVFDGESKDHRCHDIEQILEKQPDWSPLRRVKRTPDQITHDVAFICFSSGTSGLVKGVRLSHANVVANVHQQGRCLNNMFTHDTVFTLVVPFYHILGLAGFCIQYLAHGAPIVVFQKFDIEKFLTSISRDKVTHVNVVPPIALAILQSPLSAKADFSSVKCLMNAAAPLKQNLATALCKLVGCVVTQWYGMTEAAPSVISQREDEAHIPNTIGRLLPGMQLRIVEEDGKDVLEGTPGELLIRGPNLMQGYQGQDELSKSTLLDGFFRTGDAGYIDKDGFIFLTDRVKELIKVKGNQVAPAELESLLLTHPSVLDAAVCGLYLDEEATEYPIAYITTSEPSTRHAQLAIDVAEYVGSQVTNYKRLKAGVYILDTIPKNPSGKILRRCLPARTHPTETVRAARAFRAANRSRL